LNLPLLFRLDLKVNEKFDPQPSTLKPLLKQTSKIRPQDWEKCDEKKSLNKRSWRDWPD